MKGRLLWLFWIGIIGIMWNLILIGRGLWEWRKLRRESELYIEPWNPVWLRLWQASLRWRKTCLRKVEPDYPAKTLLFPQEREARLQSENTGYIEQRRRRVT